MGWSVVRTTSKASQSEAKRGLVREEEIARKLGRTSDCRPGPKRKCNVHLSSQLKAPDWLLMHDPRPERGIREQPAELRTLIGRDQTQRAGANCPRPSFLLLSLGRSLLPSRWLSLAGSPTVFPSFLRPSTPTTTLPSPSPFSVNLFDLALPHAPALFSTYYLDQLMQMTSHIHVLPQATHYPVHCKFESRSNFPPPSAVSLA